MSTEHGLDVEPDASATVAVRRRFLGLLWLFLAGPVIWMIHFFVVYLPAEALCTAGVETEVLGLHVVSVFTLVATAFAVALIGLTSYRAYRRWRASGAGWVTGDAKASEPAASGGERDGQLALVGFLLGLLFAVAVLFVGLPAAVLAC